MDRQTAAIALHFLQRLQLTGAEAPAYMNVQAALSSIASGAAELRAEPQFSAPVGADEAGKAV